MYSFSSSSSFNSSSNSNSNTPPPPPPMYYPAPNFVANPDALLEMDQQMAHQMNYSQPGQVANHQNFGQMAHEQYSQFGVVQEQYYAPQHFEGFPVMGLPYQPMDQLAHSQQDPIIFGAYPAQMENLENMPSEDAQLAPKKKQKRQPKKKETAAKSCVNCGVRETSMWRTNELGQAECNPCNLYERTNKRKRPESLWEKPRGQRRRRPVCQKSPVHNDVTTLKSTIKEEPHN